MQFGLTKAVLGCKLFVEISNDEYLAIKSAKSNLFQILYLEQKFDILVENYIEFEIELLSSSTKNMVTRNLEYSWFQKETNKLNRRIANLLSSCRLYLDHAMHHISDIFGDGSEQSNTVKAYKSQEYESKLGYRVMEALRNYVQHRGFPVKKWQFNIRSVDKNKAVGIAFTLDGFIIIEDLREDNKFKKSIITELKKLGEEIDAKPLIREYIAGIANIHEKIRKLFEKDKKEWDNEIYASIEKFKKEAPPEEGIVGLCAVIPGTAKKYNEIVPIFTELIEYIRNLEAKNRSFEGLEIRYVTNEISP